MTLRTPRRRISPRTKRRYRAIREFFRRALGSPSEPDIKINSSIAINVSDLKHKIVGLEQQLNKHCQDLVYLDSISQRESESFNSEPTHDNIGQVKDHIEAIRRSTNDLETKVLYKTSESHYRRSDESDYTTKIDNDDKYKMKSQNFNIHDFKSHKKIVPDKIAKDYIPNIHKHKTRSAFDNVASAYSSSSFRSLAEPKSKLYEEPAGYSGQHNVRRHSKREVMDLTAYTQERDKRYKDPYKRRNSLVQDISIRNYEDKRNKSHKSKHKSRELNQDFIADIIKKQYKPVKMFGRKESGISQFSAPVCRDQEFRVEENIIEGSELCSCCFDGQRHHKYIHRKDVSDMRSVCDTRLYSTKRRSRSKNHRKQFDMYNDSNLYDLVPVKEKTSPKSRRKFVEDTKIVYNKQREVPPSPRTQRPRLNLKSQYYAELEDMANTKHQNIRQSPHRSNKKHQEDTVDSLDSVSDISTNITQKCHSKHRNKLKYKAPNKQDIKKEAATISSVQYTHFENEHANVTADTGLDKTQDTDLSTDKTDKALCEIKDILQNFLQEIKKDTTASQFDKSEIITKPEETITGQQHTNTQINSSAIPNAGHNVNNFNPNCSLSPFMPPFPNPCCYPIMPMCPMNCVQSGYIVSSPSFTCATCANHSKESTPKESNHKNYKEARNSETEELIKEIYKYIAQSPTPIRKNEAYVESSLRKEATPETKYVTSRSVGGSYKSSKHDAKVGTPRIKCYSKSCEAIGSKLRTDTYCSNTNASYSDTILEKMSLEATASQYESESSETAETPETNKKKSKFTNVLRSIGLLKKKKRDTIEELSESGSAVEVHHKQKMPPFRQEILNYSMLGQQYFNKPPMPHKSQYVSPPPDYRNEYQLPPYKPTMNEYQIPHDMYYQRQVHEAHIHEQAATRHFHPQNPSALPFPSYESYSHMQSQIPLCLKEIEVKSTGTQSERRMSIFNKFKKKIQPPQKMIKVEDPIKTCSTQTKAVPFTPVVSAEQKPGLFNWKNLQAKAMQGVQGFNEPMAYTYKTQKQLVDGDKRMRNAMLRKLFYKKNPLSPNNLLVRTIMGKDKSSFGDPPRLGRAKMFF